jgi:hypothetical protein
MTFDPQSKQATAVRDPRKKNSTAAVTAHADSRPPADHVLIRLPTHTYFGDGRYAAMHLDITLTRRRAAALNFAWASMSVDGVRYAGGRSSHPEGTVVENGAAAINKLLDDLADGIEQQTGKDLTTDFGFEFSRG